MAVLTEEEQAAARVAADAAAAAAAADAETKAKAAAAEAAKAAAAGNENALGDAGKRALDAERAAATEARRETAAAKAELDELRKKHMTDHEKAIEDARAEGAKSVTSKINERILLSEVRVAAAGKLADPADAVRLLDLSKFTVTDDGTVDTKAIQSAIDELVKSKPYLAGAKPTGGSGDQGARGAAGNGLTKEALKNMTQEQVRALKPADIAAALAGP